MKPSLLALEMNQNLLDGVPGLREISQAVKILASTQVLIEGDSPGLVMLFQVSHRCQMERTEF
jgi:hypothetical protein